MTQRHIDLQAGGPPKSKRRRRSQQPTLQKRSQRLFIGAFAGIVLALGVFGAVAWQRLDQLNSRRSAASEPAPPAEKISATDDSRPVYRYSVVPGGVRSPEEMLNAMTDDTVVAEHYAGVDPAKMRAERLLEPMQAHVSYRIADRVYWTSRTITLQAGEQVLTDGKTIVRGRCGNKVSVDPLLPMLDNEPRPAAFDSIINPVSASRQGLDPAMSYLAPPSVTSSPLMPGAVRTVFGGSPFGGPAPAMDLPGIVTTGTPRSGGGASPSPALFSAPPSGGPPPGGPLPGDPPVDPPGGPPPGDPPGNPPSPPSNPPGPPSDPPDDPPGGGIDPRSIPHGDPPPDFPPQEAPTPVPEPGTLLLVAAGAAALLARRLKKQSQ